MSGVGASSGHPPLPAGVADERFAANLRGRREELRLTQADVSRDMSKAGWSYHPQTIQRIESGNRKVSIGEAQAIARILRTTTDRLTASSTAVEEQLDTARAELQRTVARLADARAAELSAAEQASHLAAKVARLEKELGALIAGAEASRAEEGTGDASGRRAGQVVTIRPQASADPRSLIAEKLRDGRAVVLDLNAAKDDATQIIDFAAGVAAALDATTERVGGDADDVLARILLLAPPDMALSAGDLARIDAAACKATSDDGAQHEEYAGAAATAAASAWRGILSGGMGEGG